MFFSEYKHSLDAKGRLTMPAKYRKQLAQGLMIAKGDDYCLQVYPPEAWKNKEAEVLALDTTSEHNRRYMRAFFSGADDGELDATGRLLIKEPHRDWAGLRKEVAVVGAGEFVELWDAERWEAGRAQREVTIGQRDVPAPGRPDE